MVDGSSAPGASLRYWAAQVGYCQDEKHLARSLPVTPPPTFEQRRQWMAKQEASRQLRIRDSVGSGHEEATPSTAAETARGVASGGPDNLCRPGDEPMPSVATALSFRAPGTR